MSYSGANLSVRAYSSADRTGCLAIFDSNVPESFTVAERSDFERFLDHLPGPYLVLLDELGAPVACGGYAVNPGTDCADLCWGMVVRHRQREGIGNLLTALRLQHIREDPGLAEVVLRTSHVTSAFYERFGFIVEDSRMDGIAPGLHLYTMRLRLHHGDGASSIGGITER